MSKKTYNPGQIAQVSAGYEIVGPRGARTGKERTVTKGEPYPQLLRLVKVHSG